MQTANVKWEDGIPYSLDFDDVYYSSDNGLAETDYVFIQHNQLIERFDNLTQQNFTIIETGFGTGLNFFCAAQHFLQYAAEQATLNFMSIERYPLSWKDFQRANKQWPMFETFVNEMQPAYTKLQAGINQITLSHNRVHLTLMIGDISEHLQSIHCTPDAWFLDGFAPAKNSSIWTTNLFDAMQQLSKTGSTFATFTSAGHIRRQLLAAGFDVKKANGYGKKREMLYGRLP